MMAPEPLRKRPANNIHLCPFTPENFTKKVLKFSGAMADDKPTPQTSYLADYLLSLKAETLVVEAHYIDRHYMEEVAIYYSRCLIRQPNAASRIHVFSRRFSISSLRNALKAAAQGRLKEVQKRLQKAYLGYIVVRPNPSVPIGRTVLSCLADDADRRFDCTIEYPVHFFGIELKVLGLAFQQQDRAVAACATTAVWSALQRLCRNEGDRAPTPSAITEAAVRHFIPQGRPFPSAGLRVEQLCDALRSFDFPAVSLSAADNTDYFRLILNAHLRSGMPVLLALKQNHRGHAVTVMGYRQDKSLSPAYHYEKQIFHSQNSQYQQVYIHDDRLGPYASATFLKIPANTAKKLQETLTLKIKLPSGKYDDWTVQCGLFPLYPKIRTTADELHDNAIAIGTMLRDWDLHKMGQLGFSLFFSRAGSYMASLYKLGLSPARIARFQQRCALSRYVGVIRWSLADKLLMDTVWDTTDTIRKQTRFSESLLGIVALNSFAEPFVDWLASQFKALPG